MLCDRVAQMLEEEERQRVRRLHQAVQEFREQEQPPHTRREWDLYNPEGLRLDQPARVSDYDPRCGPASLQRFAGEDLALPTRRRLQQEQQCRSLEDQCAERQRALADAKYAGGSMSTDLVVRAGGVQRLGPTTPGFCGRKVESSDLEQEEGAGRQDS